MMPQPLDYQATLPAATRRVSPSVAALGATFAGEVVSTVLLFVLLGGGPIFPFTVVYAPVAIVAELYPGFFWAYIVYLFVAGPLLLAAYGYVAARWARAAVWVGLTCIHLACFAVVCWLRAVIWPW